MNEKAVSEVFSYMLIFGIVIATISIVYTQVYTSTIETSQKFKVEGIRESFRKIYNVFVLSVYGGASVQQIQIELQGGRLFTENSTYVRVKVGDDTFEFYTRSLNYQLGDYRISFENGALWDGYYGYNRSVQTPAIYIKTVQVPQASGMEKVLVLVFNDLENEVSVAGEGALLIVFNSTLETSKLYSGGKNVEFEVKSPYADLWEEYLRNFGTVDRLNNTVKLETFSGSVILTVYKTNITIRHI
ncbi:MAG: hypothetical protein NZ879_02820 [Archaeoglobaceae archaeon]|nr:hypothetical protein [Archaeoglobaceae archaeon]MDW8117898.1 hypothetical protein [Archaeoglobaceae archaeon]